MGFEDILGQERAVGLVRTAIEQGRMGHAYLFSGPEGVGKTLCALRLAAAVLCRGTGERPCGKCAECRMTALDRHPDLSLIEPEGNSRLIKIDQVRELIHYLTLRPVQADRRVAILRDADRMEEAQANALLKTLEEPPAFALLILTASRPRTLLPTIRSRCQEVRFGPLSRGQVEEALSRGGYEPGDESRTAARLAGGSAGRAMQIIESDALAIYSALTPRILALPEEDAFELSDELLAWMKQAEGALEPQRERLREYLDLLSRTYAEIIRRRACGETEDPASPLAEASQRLSVLRAMRIIEAIWAARRQTDANAAFELVLQDLFERIAVLQQRS